MKSIVSLPPVGIEATLPRPKSQERPELKTLYPSALKTTQRQRNSRRKILKI
jgi:hypothetical protein